MSEFHFIRPLWLLALLPYLLVLSMLLRNRLGQGDWAQVCDAELLPYLLQDKPAQHRRWPQFGLALAGLLCIFALAGPTWERLPAPVFRNAAVLVIALDLSRSMDAEDIKPSRLIRARYKIADILKRRKDGQTALLVYADDAFTVTPLTDDTQTIDSQLSALNTGIMPSSGSNTANAIRHAAALLKQAGLQQGDILLVTDGADSDALAAARELGAYQLSVLAVGTAEGAPIKNAGSGFVKDAQGNIVVPKLNIEALRRLADTGGGLLQLLRDDDSDIDTLQLLFERQSAAQSKTGKAGERFLDQWRDFGPWLLLPVLPLAALAFRRGVLCFALLLLLPLPKYASAFSWQDLWRTPNQQARQAFDQQHYDEAAQRFDDPAWKAAAQYKAGQYQQAVETLKEPQTADDFYNRGNALAKAGQLPESIKEYDKALQLNPQHEDAKYNKAQVEQALLQQQKQQQQSGQQKGEQDQGEQQNSNGQQNGQQQGAENRQPEERNANEASQQHGQNGQQQKTENGQSQQTPPEQQQQQAAQAKPEEQGTDKDGKAQQEITGQALPNEQQQADEQWLKRIPDDPSGLLRRKFAYQYGQRRQRNRGDQQW